MTVLMKNIYDSIIRGQGGVLVYVFILYGFSQLRNPTCTIPVQYVCMYVCMYVLNENIVRYPIWYLIIVAHNLKKIKSKIIQILVVQYLWDYSTTGDEQ